MPDSNYLLLCSKLCWQNYAGIIIASLVPRGALRKRWIERKHLVRVELKRSFSSSAVRDTIAKETAHLKISNTFTLLECVGQRLVIASNQQPNGDAIHSDSGPISRYR